MSETPGRIGRPPERADYVRPFTLTNAEMVDALRVEHPTLKTVGLMRELAAAFPDDAGLDLPDFRKVPDGFILDAAGRRLDVFEVEISHPLSRETLLALCDLWLALDTWDVEMHLYVVNRYGHINEVNLENWYYQLGHVS